MASQQLPIRLQSVADLPQLGIGQNSFKFGALTIESEKYICIRDEGTDGNTQVVVVELENANNVVRRTMKAEAAIMNPQLNVIALKAKGEGNNYLVQVYDLTNKQKLKVHEFPEAIVYWRWLTARKLAMVTARSVWHWSMEGNEVPQKIFDRSGALAEQTAQIIGYTTDTAEKWCLLTAISTPDGGKTINGSMQLYMMEMQQQQMLEGHAGCFGDIPLHDGQGPVTCFSFAEKKHAESITRIHVMEVNRPAEGTQKFKATTDLTYTQDVPNDFPVSMHMMTPFGVVAMITKFGYLYMFETTGANLIYRSKISEETIFATCKNTQQNTVIAVNRRGQALAVAVEPNNIVQFIQSTCRHLNNPAEISFKLAQRFSLSGAEELMQQQFNRMLATGDVKGAARMAGSNPGGQLRSMDTINMIKQLPQQPGQPHPLLAYFQTLLEMGKLNKIESIELARPVLQQGKKQYLETWLKEEKLECSEELGDLVKEVDQQLGLQIMMKGSVSNPQKVLAGFVETNQFDKIGPYCQQHGISPDYVGIIRSIAGTNPDAALNLAKQAGTRIDINQVAEIFISFNNLQGTTAYLLDVLKENKSEHGHLQTKLLELNITAAPQVAETIMQMELFTHYDKIKIAQLCERAGLFQRALENYSDINDIRRVMLNTHQINHEFLIAFFGHMTPNNALQCLYDLLKHNKAQNLNIVVQTAIKYAEQLTIDSLVEMFESFGSFEGIFYFLGSVLPTSEDPDVHFKYIEAAAKLNQSKEVERVVRETSVYDPARVKEFLKDCRMPDPRPLIYLCDMHGFCEDLTRYLYRNNLRQYIEVYVVKMNNSAAPVVLGSLLDLDCDESYVKQILNNLRQSCPADTLVEEMESRNKLRVIQHWLEDRAREGVQTASIHTALAKIYIDINKDPQSFLVNNTFYDSKVVGKYYEDRDPHLAVTAYQRAWGECDYELIDITNKNALYRLQARYLVERQSTELWAHVLNLENTHRRQVIDQVVASALPECKSADEVSCAVKAFIAAELPNELIELLEKIVLHNSEFSNNRNLQNLLILTAIKSDQTRVVDYINRLDNYDGPDLAKIALGQYGLYEEAFLIYKKHNCYEEAIEVLINNIENIERAQEFAEKISNPQVWSRLGKAMLDANMVEPAIESYIKADDPTNYLEVIYAAQREEKFEKLINFLKLARNHQLHQKDSKIDSELIFSFAKCQRLSELEEFIMSSNQADIGAVGDRCYESKLYEAGRILFTSISNWGKLASCLVMLKRFPEALDAAKKANTPKTWKEVAFACVVFKEFKLAALAGLNIIIHPDHLEELIAHYERYGYWDELISLLETGIAHERSHIGIFTELGVMYAKYHPEKLMDHCKSYNQRLNIPKLLRACERYKMWQEAVYLYIKYDEFDNAIITMMDHSPIAWNHELFTGNIVKASNQELFYKAMIFYLEEQPMQLNDLLNSIKAKVDHSKTVQVIRKTGYLPLILTWLQSVQMYNVAAVNEAVNEILCEDVDYESLRTSVTEYDNFDQIALAQQIERHELLEMRRIAAYLYRNNQRFSQSLAISKADEVYQDAMETVEKSKSPELAEELLQYFISINDKEAFCAATYTCYDLLKPDIVMEYAWRANIIDYAIPYMIQATREIWTRVHSIERKAEVKEKKDEEAAEAKVNQPLDTMDAVSMMIPGLNQVPAIMAPGMATSYQTGMVPPPGMYMSQDPMQPGFQTQHF